MQAKNTSFLSAVLILFIITCPAYAYYEVIDLGTLGGAHSGARFINDNGQIVGWARNSSGNQHACLFDSTGNGDNIDLGTLGGNESGAHCINNAGQIVGGASDISSNGRACLFDPTGGGVNIDLGTLEGGNFSAAMSINDSSQIAGWSHYGSLRRACLFDPAGSGDNINLGSLWVDDSEAHSINNNGQIVGWADVRVQPPIVGLSFNACLFDPSGEGYNEGLGSLGLTNSCAYSINDNGQIVGYANVSYGYLDSRQHACLFVPGPNIDLGTTGIFENSEALCINDNGQIVGNVFNKTSWVEPDIYRACLFDSTGGGANIDLNTIIDPSLGWTLTGAYCINNNGWIVGSGINPDGDIHAFLLTPEPSTILLLGFSGLTILRRRKSS